MLDGAWGTPQAQRSTRHDGFHAVRAGAAQRYARRQARGWNEPEMARRLREAASGIL